MNATSAATSALRAKTRDRPPVDVRELSFGWIVTGPEEMRKAVRMFIKYGVDLIKLNLSGEDMTDCAAEETPMSDEEVAMAVKEAKRRKLPGGVRKQIDADANRLQFRGGLKNTAWNSGLVQRQPERQPADPGANDNDIVHASFHTIAGMRQTGMPTVNLVAANNGGFSSGF